MRAADATRGAALPVRLDPEAKQEQRGKVLRRLGDAAGWRGVAVGASARRFVGSNFRVSGFL